MSNAPALTIHLEPPCIRSAAYTSAGELLRFLFTMFGLPYQQHYHAPSSFKPKLDLTAQISLSWGAQSWDSAASLAPFCEAFYRAHAGPSQEPFAPPTALEVLIENQLQPLIASLQEQLRACAPEAFSLAANKKLSASLNKQPSALLNKVSSLSHFVGAIQQHIELGAGFIVNDKCHVDLSQTLSDLDQLLGQLEQLVQAPMNKSVPSYDSILLATSLAPLLFPVAFLGVLPDLKHLPDSFCLWVDACRQRELSKFVTGFYQQHLPSENISYQIPSSPLGDFLSAAQGRLARRVLKSSLLEMSLAWLRRHKPLLKLGSTLLTTRYHNATELLENSMEVSSVDVYADKFERFSGAFVLGMDPCPMHTREKELLQETVAQPDLARVQQQARAYSQELLCEFKEIGSMDVVQDYCRAMVLRVIVESYFGLGAITSSGTATPSGSTTLAYCLKKIFQGIFLNFTADTRLTAQADHAAVLMREIIMRKICANKVADDKSAAVSSTMAAASVLHKLLQQQANLTWLDDESVFRNISGLAVGALETITMSATAILQVLLQRPEEWRLAQQAAREGDDPLVLAYCMEALRINPPMSLLIRQTKTPMSLQAFNESNTELYKAQVEQGSTVIISVLSALRDEDVFADAGVFVAQRHADILQFGYGFHRCQGQELSKVMLLEIVRGLLLLPAIKNRGNIQYDGLLPRHWEFLF